MWSLLALLFVPANSQCAAPVVDGQSPSGSCAEGDTIADFGTCTPQCADGYILSVPDISGLLFCYNGQYSPPTFTCAGISCAVPLGIPFGGETEGPYNCEENWTEVPHGSVCTPKCQQGFTPDASNLPWDPVLRKVYLPCVAGVLSPSTFTCLGSPCPIPPAGHRPGEIPNANQERPCSLKLNLPEPLIPHEGFCDPLCVSGYHPNVSLIPCFAGKLNTLWECLGDPCPAPELIQFSANVTCKEGPEVPHDGTCTPNCSPGYTATESGLNCLAGALIPPRFECFAMNCTAHHWLPGAPIPLPGYNKTVAYSGAANEPVIEWIPPEPQTCEQGASISSGAICTVQCQPGYLPDIPALHCHTGTFNPPLYNCIGQACTAPSGVPDAPAVPCTEGKAIPHGEVCTLFCDQGFVPSLVNLTCNATSFEPSNFSCIGLPCSYPTGVPFAAVQPCLEPEDNLTHGATCTTQCQDGYIPTEPVLHCYGTQLRPSSFQCLPSSTFQSYELPGSLIAKAWSKNLATVQLRESFVLTCHKDDYSQSMHCSSMLSGATLLRQGDRSSVTSPDVEEFVMKAFGTDKVMACYKLESGSSYCRSLEVSGVNLLQRSQVHLGGDTYQLSLAVLDETRAVVCFQRGLSYWICRVVTSTMSLGSELSTAGTLSGLAIASPEPSQVIVCTAVSDLGRATTCHLLSVSNTDSLSVSSSILVSQGANFLAMESLASSSTVICYSDWAGTSAAACKLLQLSGSALQEAGHITVDNGTTRYLTIAAVREDRLLLCFERQGPQGLPCVDDRLQCEEWAEAGECAYNPKYMEELCRRSCGICTEVGSSRGQCNVLGLSSGELKSGPETVVNQGITWNLAASKVDNDTALVCFSDSTVRDAGRCSSVWAPRSWEVFEARACDGSHSCLA